MLPSTPAIHGAAPDYQGALYRIIPYLQCGHTPCISVGNPVKKDKTSLYPYLCGRSIGQMAIRIGARIVLMNSVRSVDGRPGPLSPAGPFANNALSHRSHRKPPESTVLPQVLARKNWPCPYKKNGKDRPRPNFQACMLSSLSERSQDPPPARDSRQNRASGNDETEPELGPQSESGSEFVILIIHG